MVPPPVVPAEAVQQAVMEGDGVVLDGENLGVFGEGGLSPAHDHGVVRHDITLAALEATDDFLTSCFGCQAFILCTFALCANFLCLHVCFLLS